MFDPTKPVQTRDGRKARILCTDKMTALKPDGPNIVALVQIPEGIEEQAYSYRPDGTCFSAYREDGRLDLVNIPERTYKYENVYVSTDGKYPSKGVWVSNREAADKLKLLAKRRVCVIKYTLEDNVVICVELEND